MLRKAFLMSIKFEVAMLYFVPESSSSKKAYILLVFLPGGGMREIPKSQRLPLDVELVVCVALINVLFWKINVVCTCRSVTVMSNWIKFHIYA